MVPRGFQALVASSSSSSAAPSCTSESEQGRNDEVDSLDDAQEEGASTPCPHCKNAMQWCRVKGRNCSNSRDCKQRCETTGRHRWWCENCNKDICIGCYSSLRAIIESEEGWCITRSRRSPGHGRNDNPVADYDERGTFDVGAQVESFCQRWELDDWARLELGGLHPGEVGMLLAHLSGSLQADAKVDVRALITAQKSSNASSTSKLSNEKSKLLQHWILGLKLPDLKAHELLAAASQYESDEVDYLIKQSGFAGRCRQGAIQDPTAMACGIMNGQRLERYTQQVTTFARRLRLSHMSQQQLLAAAPSKGARLMSNWSHVKSSAGAASWGNANRPIRGHGAASPMEALCTEIALLNATSKTKQKHRDKQEHLQAGSAEHKNAINAVARPHARIMEEFSDAESEDMQHDSHAKEVVGAEDADCPAVQAFGQGCDDEKQGIDGPMSSDSEGDDEDDELMPLPLNFDRASTSVGNAVPTPTMLRSSTSELDASGHYKKARVPVPSHFVVVVDVSGSMSERDCQSGSGKKMLTRMDAVLSAVKELASSEHGRGCDDRMSFITFNDVATMHFECLTLEQSRERFKHLQSFKPAGRTSYAAGLRAAALCIRTDARRRPADIIFFSDGEPSDPESMLPALTMDLLPTRGPRDLKVYCIGFGKGLVAAASGISPKNAGPHRAGKKLSNMAKREEADGAFGHLQQLAQVGNGSFHQAGASVASLHGAFMAVSSTIATSRTTSLRQSQIVAGEHQNANEEKRSAEANFFGQDEDVGKNIATNPAPPQASTGAVQTHSVEKQVTFELRSSIFDLGENDLGHREVEARRISFEFDGRVFRETEEHTIVEVRRSPFTKGGMRLCYGMRDKSFPKWHKMIAKRTKFECDEGFDPRNVVDVFAKQSAVAHYYAKRFRRHCEQMAQLQLCLDFIPCFAYRPEYAEDGDLGGFCGEQYLAGSFVKLTSNAGFVNREEYGAHANVAEAFSHYTFHHSRGALLVADIQGICAGNAAASQEQTGPSQEDQERLWLLSDPQVLTDGSQYNFGRGDLGMRGMQMFFKNHKCSWLCKALRLDHIHQLKPPTLQCYIPGSTNVLAGLFGKEGQFVTSVRRACNVTSIVLPRQAYAEWLPISVWASTTSKAKDAARRIKERCRELVSQFGLLVPVPPHIRLSSDEWRARRSQWVSESGGAQIALYRGGTMYQPQPEDGTVLQVWLFPKELTQGKGQAHASVHERDVAKEIVERDFALSAQIVSNKILANDYVGSASGPTESSSKRVDVYSYVMQMSGAAKLPVSPTSSKTRESTIVATTCLAGGSPSSSPQKVTDEGEDWVEVLKPRSPASKTTGAGFAWLIGTTWREDVASYEVAAGAVGQQGCFEATKTMNGKYRFKVPLFTDRQGLLTYGHKGKWYAKEATAKQIVWAELGTGRVANTWQRSVGKKQTSKDDRLTPIKEKKGKKDSGLMNEQNLAPTKWVPESGHLAEASGALVNDDKPRWSDAVDDELAGCASSPCARWLANKQNVDEEFDRELLEPKQISYEDDDKQLPDEPLQGVSFGDFDQPEAALAEDDRAAMEDNLAQRGVSAAEEEEDCPDAGREWTKYLNEANNSFWWWHHSGRRWFLEGDTKWTRYKVPDDLPGGGRFYWWNNHTEEIFYEDTGCQD